MPKDIESLEQSRKIRKAVIEKYGEVPSSVWNIDYSWGKHIKEMDEIKQDNVALDKHKKMDYGEKKTITTLGGEEINVLDKSKLRKAFKMSSVNVRGKGSGVSTFPPDLARRIVLYYSKENDTVLDCFSGHNSRLQVTYELNRNYIGYDICSSYMRFNEKVRDEITGKGTQKLLFAPKNFITLREKSSEKLDEEDNSVDMIYSSPPYYCFTEDSEIITLEGIKKIKDIKRGDYVYSHLGKFRKVLGVSSRYITEKVKKINIWGNQIPIEVTPNHKLYAVYGKQCPYYKKRNICKPDCGYLRNGNNIKHKCRYSYKKYSPSWIESEKLTKNDFLLYPINTTIKNIKEIKISDYVKNVKIENNIIKLNNNQYGVKDISNVIKITEDFLRLCGYFIAEGHAYKSEINFSFNKNEEFFISDVENIFMKIWGIKSNRTIQNNVCQLKFYRSPLASLFNILFGEYSYNKKIPEFIMFLPPRKQMFLVEGYYYGDGFHILKNGCGFTSVSPTLIEQLKQILLRNRIIFNMNKNDRVGKEWKVFGNKVICRHANYILNTTAKTEVNKFSKFIKYKKVIKKNKTQTGRPYSFIRGNYLYMPIRKIQDIDYKGNVYNCEVDADNSYTLNTTIAHNCLEYYDDNPQQLGYNKTYDEFLEGLLRVIKESYRVLKPNKYCIFNVNDFRKDGKLYTFHCDTIDLFKKAGFRIWDIIIIKWQMSVGNCFASQVEEEK